MSLNTPMKDNIVKQPSPKGGGPGRFGSSPAPFDKPQSIGKDTIPNKMFESLSGSPAGNVNSPMKDKIPVKVNPDAPR